MAAVRVVSHFSMRFQGFSDTFKSVLFGQKGRRKDKDSPTPPISDEQKQYLEENCIRQRVIDADFDKLVELPPSLDNNEWLATHTISFFNHVNLMYGVVSEYCTAESCATMVGPDNVQYHWLDEKGKKQKQSAPQYIDHMMSYVQKSVTDEAQFPTKFGQEFPSTFTETVRKIHRYLFHVLAHVYHSHYGLMVQLGLHGHLNTLFTHFMVFSAHFHLIDQKETDVLQDLHKGLMKALQDPSQNPDASRRDDSPEDEDEAKAEAEAEAAGSARPDSPEKPGSGADHVSDRNGAGSKPGSQNGAAATGVAVQGGGKTLVGIPST